MGGSVVKPPRRIIDWEALEVQYRAGIRSLKEIGHEFGVSDAGIIKRAKRDGWERDLKAKIHAKAEAKVSAALVSAEVSANRKATERQVIEANADAIVRVRMAHRGDIHRSRNIVMSLLDELEQVCGPDNAALLAELGEIMREPDDRGQDKRADLYAKLLSLNGRSVTMKNLGESLKTMVALEREAFGLSSAATPDGDGNLSLKVSFGG